MAGAGVDQMAGTIKHGVFVLLEMLLRLCVAPRLRSNLLRLFGAKVGKNVRVYECRFINLENGFKNLHLADDVHVGADCLFDLKGPVRIGRGTTLSPRVTIISHSDPGSSHGSPIVAQYPCEAHGVTIGDFCWIGTSATILSGAIIGSGTVVGAAALVRGDLQANSLYVGVPARRIKSI
ncbi:acyltransferase [Rehaibacterium terrae]|uniref:acyltransferase n=1 Tax=Rehaibacterium terrae TaxID=1341696 RepID=UPI00391AC488